MSQQALKSRQEFTANLLASAGTGVANILVTNPINTLKIRWQVQSAVHSRGSQSLWSFFSNILAEDGLWTGLWRPGLVPGLTASVASIGVRYGAYPLVRDSIGWAKASYFGSSATSDSKVGPTGMFMAGLLSGMVGYFLASPGLMIMTQMQAEAGRIASDGRYVSGARIGQPPSYSGMLHALQTIANNGASVGSGRVSGALFALWRGSSVISLRGGVLNASQMMGYDFTKTRIKQSFLLEDGPPVHVFASVVAALCATTASMPLDVTLTFYQSSVNLGGEHKRYGSHGPLACARMLLQQSGPSIFMRGWIPNFGKMLPTCVFSMYVYEQFRKLVGLGYLD